MYTKYFGFNEKPFTLTPNPRFIYLSNHHKEAFAHLLYGINNHYGFISLIGEVGTGKTTVLRTLLNQLQEDSYTTALIFNPCLTAIELLRSVCNEFGLASDSTYANELLATFNDFLLRENTSGRTVVLVIDEAQNLQPEVLEQVRLISNLETEDDKLIQIVLAGQPELSSLLARPELRQLNQRIAVTYRLKSMAFSETRAYIRHRMTVAGETGGVSFGTAAIYWIYLYTHGIPRMINVLCDRCLLVAYGKERRTISTAIVTNAIQEIINEPDHRRFRSLLVGFFLALSITLCLFVPLKNSYFDKHGKVATTSSNISSIGTKQRTEHAVQQSISSSLASDVMNSDQRTFHLKAFNALAASWNVSELNTLTTELKTPKNFSKLASKRNLRLTSINGTIDEILKFNVPFLIRTNIGLKGNEYYLAVTKNNNDSFTVAPQIGNRTVYTRQELTPLLSGFYLVSWQNFAQLPDKLIKGEQHFETRSLQTLLRNAGYYHGVVDGMYGNETIKAVTDFQRNTGLPLDETVGEITLAALTRFYVTRRIPLLTIPDGKTR